MSYVKYNIAHKLLGIQTRASDVYDVLFKLTCLLHSKIALVGQIVCC